MTGTTNYERLSRGLLGLGSVPFALGALSTQAVLMFLPRLAAYLDAHHPWVTRATLESARTGYGLTAVLLFVLAYWAPGSLLGRKGVARILLVGGLVLLPLWGCELTMRIAFQPKSTLFLPDTELGWKLRPGAEDQWGGVTVKINDQGLRGPAYDYEKPEGVRRVLCLGDSVTFGFRLANDSDTYPAQLESVLRSGGEQVQVINAGVDGYSPWQEKLFLEQTGIRYQPDLVVVGFVLNDVTEKFNLERFGGSTQGTQLQLSAVSHADYLIGQSALLSRVREEFRRRTRRRARATEMELLNVERLVREPDNEFVGKAWELTLKNLEQLVALCEAREIPCLLVVFPFRFQLEDPEQLSGPQHRLESFARERELLFLDLMPHLEGSMYLDHDHLDARGCAVVAEQIARLLRKESQRTGFHSSQ